MNIKKFKYGYIYIADVQHNYDINKITHNYRIRTIIHLKSVWLIALIAKT